VIFKNIGTAYTQSPSPPVVCLSRHLRPRMAVCWWFWTSVRCYPRCRSVASWHL